MEAVLVRVLDLLGHSPILQALTSAVPLAIAVAGLAGWRAKVPHTLPLAHTDKPLLVIPRWQPAP